MLIAVFVGSFCYGHEEIITDWCW